ncbi:MAG: dockerin type I repeat-containing protein [Muribaculaceae bacterium]|nr:dockerin type I repeat-containing protein [Muribaculaceae bacterium]
MKKFLLLGAVAIFAVMAGNAQIKHVEKVRNVDIPMPELIKQAPLKKMEVAQINENRNSVHAPMIAAPKANVKAWYNRPAGTFYWTTVAQDGDLAGGWGIPWIQLKPYSTYTWKNVSEGATSYQWTVEYWNGEEYTTYGDESVDLVTEYNMEMPDAPYLLANAEGGEDEYNFFMLTKSDKDYEKVNGSTFNYPSAAAITSWNANGYRIFGMSHPAILRDRSQDGYTYTYYTGATPHGSNATGYWFGKNDSGFDAICQVVEKPEHPYALKSVAVDPATVRVGLEPGTLTANVYKLLVDQPQYVDDGKTAAELLEDDLELLASMTLEVDTALAEHSWLIFPVMEKEGDLEFESSLHIDFPILVEITGYNGEHSITDDGELLTADNGMLDFSACITTDEIPEGFGEMAFIKRFKYYDFDENDEPYLLDEPYYVYEGLNNFFSSGELKAGFSILFEVEMPFIVYYYNAEDGEYEFPIEGGSFEKTYTSETGGSLTVDKLSLYSWEPSDVWTIMTPEGEDIPDWLTIETEDMIDEEEDEFSGEVQLDIQCEPLPEGVKGRECTVVFTYPGAELTYHFTQGDTTTPVLLKGDVNRDGKVNVSDVTALINMILGVITKDEESADVNKDGKINVSDVTALVNIILGTSAE